MKNKKTIIAGIIFLIFIFHWSYYDNKVNWIIEQANVEIQKEKAKVSYEEMLFNKIREYTEYSDDYLSSINIYKEDIARSEIFYETNILMKRCYQEQLKRYSENVEIDEWYCLDVENLETFKKKQ